MTNGPERTTAADDFRAAQMPSPEIEQLERRLRSLFAEASLLPPDSRRQLGPLSTRVEVALTHLRLSQLLADERLLRDHLRAARAAG